MPKLNKLSAGSAIGLTGNVSLGGGIPIWQNPEFARANSYQGGFSLTNTPTADALIPGGTPMECDEEARTAKICKRFEVYEAASGSPTTYKIVKDSGEYNMLEVGIALMKMPSAIDGTGAGYAVATLDVSNADYDTITVATTLGDVIAGDVLGEAAEVGAAVALEAVANGLSYHDIFVEDDALGYSTSSVYAGRIYNRRIRKIADIEKAELPQIIFSESK